MSLTTDEKEHLKDLEKLYTAIGAPGSIWERFASARRPNTAPTKPYDSQKFLERYKENIHQQMKIVR